jgi:antitoxin (DNA-binding transcriptional repressor) of toxin-antitoxin stability system
MIEANMLDAKTRLSQLVEAAERGEQVFLKRNGVLVAQIVPLPKSEFPFGFLKDEVGTVEDSLLFNSGEDEFEEFTRL